MQNFARNEEDKFETLGVIKISEVGFEHPKMVTANPDRETDTDIDVDIDVEDETKEEPPYRVIIHNDNITTFVFVIKVLTTIFMKNVMEADQIANRTHSYGLAVVGTYPKSMATTRINKVHFAAQLEGFPLKMTMEPGE